MDRICVCLAVIPLQDIRDGVHRACGRDIVVIVEDF